MTTTAFTRPRGRVARFEADARELLTLAEELHERLAAFVEEHAGMAGHDDHGLTYKDAIGLHYAVEVFVSFTATNLPHRGTKP